MRDGSGRSVRGEERVGEGWEWGGVIFFISRVMDGSGGV